jgi:hypothetical protein
MKYTKIYLKSVVPISCRMVYNGQITSRLNALACHPAFTCFNLFHCRSDSDLAHQQKSPLQYRRQRLSIR